LPALSECGSRFGGLIEWLGRDPDGGDRALFGILNIHNAEDAYHGKRTEKIKSRS
jgi:hypothetical protein